MKKILKISVLAVIFYLCIVPYRYTKAENETEQNTQQEAESNTSAEKTQNENTEKETTETNTSKENQQESGNTTEPTTSEKTNTQEPEKKEEQNTTTDDNNPSKITKIYHLSNTSQGYSYSLSLKAAKSFAFGAPSRA